MMEHMTATIKAASDIIDDSLTQSLNRFRETIYASELFAIENLRFDMTGKVGAAVIPMMQQHMSNDLLSKLVELLKVNILYSCKTEDGRCWRTVTYSMPCHNELYIIGMDSEKYGIVEEVSVTFFDTIDVMFAWLRDNLRSMRSSRDVFLHKQEASELYRIFM